MQRLLRYDDRPVTKIVLLEENAKNVLAKKI